jgi:hypothetical protein
MVTRLPEGLEEDNYDVYMSTYLGGGYIYKVTADTVASLQADFATMQSAGWINKQTRAVIIELSTYNVNVNLFAYATIMFEILPTENMLGSIRVDPLNLLDNNTSAGFNIFQKLLFVFLVVFFMITQVKTLLRLKRKVDYLKSFWMWMVWAVVGFLGAHSPCTCTKLTRHLAC